MQTWAKRGLQTALVTGGMLVLGAGVASATENCADRPGSPLCNGGLDVPVHLANNVVGTPVGPVKVPDVHRDINTNTLTGLTPAPIGRSAQSLTAPLGGAVNPLIKQTGTPLQARSAHDGGALRDNQVRGDLVVPVDFSGNAVALGSDAYARNESHQSATSYGPVATSGRGNVLAGNVVDANGAVPVQADGNAIGVIGNAGTDNRSSQDATVIGGVRTDGDRGTLAGNVLAGQFATPIQANGNALSAIGNAAARSDADSSARTPGALRSSGDRSTGSGNVFGLPLAVPLGANGEAASLVGNSKTDGDNGARATAGSTVPGFAGVPTYVYTTGTHGVLSGNGGEAPVSNPAELDGNAVSGLANTYATGSSHKLTRAGGGVYTNGSWATGSGSVVENPVAVPVQGFGNGLAAIGNAGADYRNNVDSAAGGSTFTNGDHSVLSGNGTNVPPAGAIDVFGNGGSLIGTGEGTGANNTTATTGGYSGTTGSEAAGSGNMISTPLALPSGGYGLGVSPIGSGGTGSGDQTETVQSGGKANTNDDHGTVTSNLVYTPVAAPAQVFGDAFGWVANVDGRARNRTTAQAGGDAKATGTKGTAAGNVAFVPASLPGQLFGVASTGVGNGTASGMNNTSSRAGGDTITDGVGGSLAGNVLAAPTGGAAQAFGDAISWIGNVRGEGANSTHSTAGGDIRTAGDRGSVSGDVLSPQLVPTAQAYGDTATVAGNGYSFGENASTLKSGGDVASSGQDGSLSGDLLTVPAVAENGVFGDAATVLGRAQSTGYDDSFYQAGGADTTSLPAGTSGMINQIPLDSKAELFSLPAALLGEAMATGQDGDITSIADDADPLRVPATLPGTDPADIPSFASLLPGSYRTLQPRAGRARALPGLPGVAQIPGVPQLPGVAQLPGVPNLPGVAQLPGLPQLPGMLTPPAPGQMRSMQVPGMPGALTQNLPLPGAAGVPNLPSSTSGVLPLGNGGGAQLSGLRLSPAPNGRGASGAPSLGSPALPLPEAARLLGAVTDRGDDSTMPLPRI